MTMVKSLDDWVLEWRVGKNHVSPRPPKNLKRLNKNLVERGCPQKDSKFETLFDPFWASMCQCHKSFFLRCWWCGWNKLERLPTKHFFQTCLIFVGKARSQFIEWSNLGSLTQALLTNISLTWKWNARDKHSNLVWPTASCELKT